MRFRFVTAAALCALPSFGFAQEPSNSILVLDASGSMWGQVDGTAKIDIARNVVRDLLTSLPESQSLGLTAYGHRKKGDCTDIETLVRPGAASRQDIASAVGGLTPRGKTPMTDAVIRAAEDLRYTEDAATVILVSDGIETCNPDPCAAARALEEAGVDLTVHVVSFDVADPEAIKQMQCLADETGGLYLSAANASELGSALQQVTQAPETYPVTLVATAGQGGPQIEDPLMWQIAQGEDIIVGFTRASSMTPELPPGTYTATVLRPSDEASVDFDFDVPGNGATVTLVLPSLLPPASVTAADTAFVGATIPVNWDGPDARDDYIAVFPVDGDRHINYRYTRDGGPAQLLMPTQPGTYDIRYIMADGREVLASQTITVSEVPATLSAPASAVAGDTVAIGWTGPDYKDDYVNIVKEGDTRGINYRYTRDGDPAQLMMPPEPGLYTVQYVMRQGNTVLASQNIEVTAVSASIDLTDTPQAGALVPVTWTGPDYRDDYINVVKQGDDRGINYRYTRDGDPAQLMMPPEPGTYDVQYVMRQGNTVLASKTVTVSDVTATLDFAETAQAGQLLSINWTGPDYKDDYLNVVKQGDDRSINYRYTRDGDPAQLMMPPEPGAYVVQYVMRQGNTVLATKNVTVSDVIATLDMPDSALAGSVVAVGWTGPDYKDDYINVVKQGDDRSINYRYTRDGDPAQLMMPPKPGAYVVQYVMRQGNTVLATKNVTVSDVTATLDFAETGQAGQLMSINWTGPDYKDDYINVVKNGDDRSINYRYTREGDPLQLLMPADPGSYTVQYVMRQGNTVLASKTVDVSDVTATLTAPPTASAGQELSVSWTGPDYDRDYISIAKPGDKRYEAYTYTREGGTLDLTMPLEPGTYELRYVMQQGDKVLASQVIEVTEVLASLGLPDTARAGSVILVEWDGPGYDRDYVSVAKQDGKKKYEAYTYTREGSPLILQMPSEPGTYEIRYVANSNGESILVRETIDLTDVTATLTAADTGVSGGVLGVEWDGPDFERDFIAIAKVDAPNNKYESYVYTSKDSPLVIKLPERPGDYELRYVVGQDKRVLTRKPVTVTLD